VIEQTLFAQVPPAAMQVASQPTALPPDEVLPPLLLLWKTIPESGEAPLELPPLLLPPLLPPSSPPVEVGGSVKVPGLLPHAAATPAAKRATAKARCEILIESYWDDGAVSVDKSARPPAPGTVNQVSHRRPTGEATH
jgi:hypothetical protein